MTNVPASAAAGRSPSKRQAREKPDPLDGEADERRAEHRTERAAHAGERLCRRGRAGERRRGGVEHRGVGE